MVPGGYAQTAPNSVTYTVTTSPASPASTGNNFANDMTCDMSSLSKVYYVVTTPGGVSTTVTNLRGNTASGDTVTAFFTVSATTTLSLVAYEAPSASYDPNTAYLQVITSSATGTFKPGSYSLTVTEPNSYYQVDFVCRTARSRTFEIGQPAMIFYHARGPSHQRR